MTDRWVGGELTDEQRESLAKWFAGREAIWDLARQLPPGCKVTSHEDAPLMIPAPGIVGVVVSYFEAGTVGVLAPMANTLTSPITGITVEAGERIKGVCRPDQLVFLEEDIVTRADIEEVLSGLEK